MRKKSYPDNSMLFVDEHTWREPTDEMKVNAAKTVVLLDQVNPRESLEILGILDDLRDLRG